MDRQHLESLSLKELREEARRYGVTSVPNSRVGCVDAILLHLENNGLVASTSVTQGGSAALPAFSGLGSPGDGVAGASSTDTGLPSASANAVNSVPTELTQLCGMLAQLLSRLNGDGAAAQVLLSPAGTVTGPAQLNRMNTDIPPHRSRTPGVTSMSTVSPAQAVKLLASQLPDFTGSEDSDVQLWIEKVECVSRIHAVSEDVTLLAATSKLSKVARKWFDLSTGAINVSWPVFKDALSRRFKRAVSFQSVMKKLEARRWNHMKKSFQDYAMEKLALMQRLRLPDRDAISYIIAGISSNSLRGTAVALHAESVDQFLEEMHDITQAFNDSNKRSPPPRHKFSTRNGVTGSAATEGQSQPQSRKDDFCVYCKIKGHVKANCFKLKRKEQGSQPAATGLSSSVAAVEEKPSETDSTVALVNAVDNRTIDTNDSTVKVVSINGICCNLFGLLDTGSPISLIKASVFQSYFADSGTEIVTANHSYKAINDTPIPISGTILADIVVEPIPELYAKIRFHIFTSDAITADMIIGRDFLNEHCIKLLYDPEVKPNKLKLLSLVVSPNIMEAVANVSISPLEDAETDFGNQYKHQLIAVFKEVEDAEVDPVQDDHCVKVFLKDESVYAFAPRRFAWGERLQIREIIDDFLTRGIIKNSTSPYCARVVPVRKKKRVPATLRRSSPA
ncbi:uncharacterized protein LOC118648438 [Monomorium pharaonis]|uniref:uncharacterized protein LOC118648438 n=1 Tax=Monomorium pharaonis TaxID=307658 RepID=UPI001746B545|nr:uncharacterized protein LOC118648438 [Monomorium pharaonis]XP_036150641.1 uncharacterized protein LOC118648438 [Monomorium pharaonis]XP_036150642.1 uncharacterized protein LOC118648438 [Monomorium pharaonis]XP_036150643.1 uncharacterized protein LOC118648438 [Monomorium pharaonis]XP_036150644.1 uncharacterized protein LOC118648438 [Monomorium pharaonis]